MTSINRHRQACERHRHFPRVHKLTCYPGCCALSSSWPQSDLKSHTCVSNTHTRVRGTFISLLISTTCLPEWWVCTCFHTPSHEGRQETSRVKRRINSATFVGAAQAHVGTGQLHVCHASHMDAEVMNCTHASCAPLGNVLHTLHMYVLVFCWLRFTTGRQKKTKKQRKRQRFSHTIS